MKKSVALVIDDHSVVRGGIKSALAQHFEYEIHEAQTKAEAMAQIARLNPALIVVDINLPDGTGLEIVDWVRKLSETVAIVVLTFSDDDLFLMSALKSGASAFIKKSAPLHELIAAIKLAIAAPLSFSAEGVAQAISRRQESFQLSSRELQILSQLATDLSLRELAQSFFISESTLKTHLTNLYRKLGVRNRLQAINVAKKSGLL